jgi:hypothetical protein
MRDPQAARLTQLALADLARLRLMLAEGDEEGAMMEVENLQTSLLDLENLVGVSTPLSLFE